MSERERFLRELETHLRLRGKRRADVINEIESHIEEAVAAGEDERRIIERLGQPEHIARAFNRVEVRRSSPPATGGRDAPFISVRAVIGATPVVAIASLVIALAALLAAREPNQTPTQAEIVEAGVRRFVEAGNQMAPQEFARLVGKPDEVYRNNPRALCWRYSLPYEIQMCWGPKRQQAWIGTNIPFQRLHPDASPLRRH
jgi:hypothetical protein